MSQELVQSPVNPVSSRRYTRQEGIVSQDLIKSYRPLVIGTGAVGSNVARQLAHMGSDMSLVDFDEVDEVNLCCQGFLESDVGKYKVDAVQGIVSQINGSVNAHQHKDAFNINHKYAGEEVIFSCADSMKVRETAFRHFTRTKKFRFLGDSRIRGGDTIRIVICRADMPESTATYKGSLFAEEEAQRGSCTTKTTIYGAFVASALLISEYVKFLNGRPTECTDFMVNLASLEMFPTNG